MLVARLLTILILMFIAEARRKPKKPEYPPGSPKGPDYCNVQDEFPCRKPHVNNVHIFCNCLKYRCNDFFPKNMTKWRLFSMYWHNYWRNLVATGQEPEMLGYGEKFPPAADMNAFSYNYAMEDAARCHVKKCVDPLQHDSCHLTPLYRDIGGGGQNAMKGSRPNLVCRWSTGPVKGCDVNTMDKYEILAYAAIRKWYEEFKDLTNESIMKIAYWDNPVKPIDYKKTGHMTALLWGKTYCLGCGSTTNPAKDRFYYTCNYYKQGNIMNRPVYQIGPEASQCDIDKPAKQLPEFKGLCGYSILPPAPPDDFFISIKTKKGRRSLGITRFAFSWLFLIEIHVLIKCIV